MITNANETKNIYGYSEERAILYGLSSDTKPTDVKNGSEFTEIDTGKKYLYDEAGQTWYEQLTFATVVTEE